MLASANGTTELGVAGTSGEGTRPDLFSLSREPVQVSASDTVTRGLSCLRLTPLLTFLQRICGQRWPWSGSSRLGRASGYSPTHRVRKWLKLVLTSGRPGSKHSGISMETEQRRTKWGWDGRSG